MNTRRTKDQEPPRLRDPSGNPAQPVAQPPSNSQNLVAACAPLWPLLLAGAAYALAFALHLASIFRLDGGQQLFVLDDPYIHAAIAKNLLLYRSFGISPGIFASASSSILWPPLVAAVFALFGMHMGLVLALNALLGLVALGLCHGVWRFVTAGFPAATASGVASLEVIGLLAVTFAGSLLSLVFLGMEHVLQFITVLSLLSAAIAIAQIDAPQPIPRRWLGWLYLSGLLAVMTRFEGAFAVAVVSSLLFLLGRRRHALLLAIVSALPILFFGWYSVRHGAYFFPNSILIKAVHGRGKLHGFRNLVGPYARSHGLTWILLLTAGELAICLRYLSQALRRPSVRLAALILALAVLHCMAGEVGWAYRYEAYLVSLSLLASAFLAAELCAEYARTVSTSQAASRASLIATSCLLLLFVLCAAPRLRQTQSVVAAGAVNVRDQQLQTARFLAHYYPDQTVVVNDVGLVSYLRDSPVLDLYGLGSDEVARLIMENRWDTSAIDAEVRKSGARVAALYAPWFAGRTRLPSTWVEVAQYKLPETPPPLVVSGIRLATPESVAGFTTVSFYAIGAEQVAPLVANLRSFAPCVPPRVTQTVQGERLAPAGVCPVGWIKP